MVSDALSGWLSILDAPVSAALDAATRWAGVGTAHGRSDSSKSGDARGGAVTAICKAEWPKNQALCNTFVIAVAGRLGVTLTGNADKIMDDIRSAGWVVHDKDGVAASEAAAAGKLVIGGMTSADLGDEKGNGHVVVVVPPTGPLGHGKYPYAYWGSLNKEIRPDGGKGTTINYSFGKSMRDKVVYASRVI